ncbi:MAG: hypothetical protein CM1200mP14_21810 [Gammaproteobacteria bacterium]|nr:MAG: hypothetical protein CM1200mP14_21810 [Gammaproteobacteria bacterium]
MTGSYDPELNLVYWGTGNPGPDWKEMLGWVITFTPGAVLANLP